MTSGKPVTSTNKTDHHDITETLLKMVLNTITSQNAMFVCLYSDIKAMAKYVLTICILFYVRDHQG